MRVKATRDAQGDGCASRRAIAGGLLGALALAAAVGLLIAALAVASPMQSTKLGPRLCETTGGGKFVRIPGFPGEMIDRRLLTDIRWIEQRYPIFITDGYSMDDVHAQNGEHPIGLALDIVPNRAEGGHWRDITALARWAEPRQNHPRLPFRWVGYDGDAGPWARQPPAPLLEPLGDPARPPGEDVETIRCPVPGARRRPRQRAADQTPPDRAAAASPAPADRRRDQLGRARSPRQRREHDGRRGGRGGRSTSRRAPRGDAATRRHRGQRRARSRRRHRPRQPRPAESAAASSGAKRRTRAGGGRDRRRRPRRRLSAR